jgi:dGTP triphosphohydrolase
VDDLDKTKRLTEKKDLLPDASVYKVFEKFIDKIGYKDKDSIALIVLDFISGMTDNYVVSCLDEIFVPKHIV